MLKHCGVWRHVAEASSPGDSITDLSPQTRFLLNPFIVPKDKKFASPMAVLRKETLFGDEKMVAGAGKGVKTGKDRPTFPDNRAAAANAGLLLDVALRNHHVSGNRL